MKVFRKQRLQLAAENRTVKYLRYAIGEIFLVVIGILIALQVNNWNQERKQAISEKEFFEGIKHDLTQDKQYIELILNSNKLKIKAYNQLNDYITRSTNPNKNYIDSLLQEYFFAGQRTFYPISGSFQSAVAGNEINTYKNKAAIRALIKLYNSTYPRLIDDAKLLDERWSLLTKKYIHERRIKHFNYKDNAQLSQILDDMYYHYVLLTWYQNLLKNTNTEIDGLLKTVNNENFQKYPPNREVEQ
jgi:hypothetical protein